MGRWRNPALPRTGRDYYLGPASSNESPQIGAVTSRSALPAASRMCRELVTRADETHKAPPNPGSGRPRSLPRDRRSYHPKGAPKCTSPGRFGGDGILPRSVAVPPQLCRRAAMDQLSPPRYRPSRLGPPSPVRSVRSGITLGIDGSCWMSVVLESRAQGQDSEALKRCACSNNKIGSTTKSRSYD